ncbi:MAG: S-layer homology domain-containing protein [Anaerotignum sp.]|jgi:hypothetical protein|nr:S-layer homology domain-containing protein [Anaerotignum sp.]MCI8868173.1 S-layer homology domain-containing protein [Anaerotignum sp.]
MKHSKKNFSKPVLFLAASLIACQPVSALGVTFSDLDKVPWPGAETSIQKAADLGLMVGETQNGKTIFRPRDKVSLCETVQLAYKLMVNTKKLTPDDSVTEKWSTTMQTYKIPEWAHPALAQCLEKKIVAITDLSSFMNNGAPREATRERATEILGRALEAAVPSLSAGGSTSFGDNAEISESARPYIALLAQQKIVSGDNQGNFNPKNTLNRSETAVLVSNLYTLLVNSASAPETPSEPVEAAKLEGKIGGMTNFYINFVDSASYYYFSNSGTAKVELNGKSSTLDELLELFRNGTELNAKLTLDSGNRIIAISVTAETSDALTGNITGCSKSSITIEGKTYPLKDSKDVRVYLDGTLRDFDYLLDTYKDGVTLNATLSLNTEKRVSKIEAKTISSNEKKGKITDLAEDEIVLDGSKSKTYEIKDADELSVTINGSKKTFEDLMELFDDDETITATVTADIKNVVSKIAATTKESSSSDKGVIASLTSSKLKLNGGDSFDIKSKAGIDIKIEDGTKESDIDSWDDLELAIKEKKEITVTVKTKNDYVSEITGRVSGVSGTIYDYDKNSLDITTKEDNEYTYEFDDKFQVDNDEINANNKDSFLTWMDEYFKRSDDIKVTLALNSDGYITRIDD